MSEGVDELRRKCEQEPVPAIPSVAPNHNAPRGQCCRHGPKLSQIICKEFELTVIANTPCSSLALTAVIEAVVPLGSCYGSTLVFDKGGGIDRGELELGE
ncbi:hypothetical protein SO802_019479 [Lithocarpus litseifolius]|uniref:Uncharacterized protein n=1 Tax=Lithocarpus litseifolius TaxID=425828 RepID=A0AAW2CP89_9ROSI